MVLAQEQCDPEKSVADCFLLTQGRSEAGSNGRRCCTGCSVFWFVFDFFDFPCWATKMKSRSGDVLIILFLALCFHLWPTLTNWLRTVPFNPSLLIDDQGYTQTKMEGPIMSYVLDVRNSANSLKGRWTPSWEQPWIAKIKKLWFSN